MPKRSRSRKNTIDMLDLVDQGFVDERVLIRDLLNWISEAEVTEFMEAYQFSKDLNNLL